MIVGVPREVKDNEFRVALTPEGARELVDAGHTVLIQEGAAEGSALPGDRYKKAGAQFVSSAEDGQTMDALALLARVVVGEADEVILLARLVGE